MYIPLSCTKDPIFSDLCQGFPRLDSLIFAHLLGIKYHLIVALICIFSDYCDVDYSAILIRQQDLFFKNVPQSPSIFLFLLMVYDFLLIKSNLLLLVDILFFFSTVSVVCRICVKGKSLVKPNPSILGVVSRGFINGDCKMP